jgi:hypothetical protein
MVEGDHPVNLCARQVKPLGDDGDRALRDIAQCRLDGVQYLDERARTAFEVRHDAANGVGISRR